MLEHGAYTLILDAYYDREQAPTKAEAIRWARARNPEETQTVSTILQEFFSERDGRYYQQRVEDELREARDKAERNRIVGKFGGRPPRARKTQTVNSGLSKKTDGLQKAVHHDIEKSYPQAGNVNNSSFGTANCIDSLDGNSSGLRGADGKTHRVSSGLPDGFQTEPQSTNPLIHNLEEEKILSVSAAPKPDGIPTEQILAAYRELLPDFPQPRKLDADRKKKITARWREDPERQSLGWWREFWGYVAKSDFLTGRSGKWSACNIDWLLQPANMRKVTEGNYENRGEA